ncbi:MAG: hypothetical protein LBC74_05695 [Planctomycetaceae bacterium]|jgi:hypothetical protein|nr:hypothetical protein [Planctomycetaceae bacterium]
MFRQEGGDESFKIVLIFFKNDLLFYDFVPFSYFEDCIDFDGYFCFVDWCNQFAENNAKKVFTTGIFKANMKCTTSVSDNSNSSYF